MSDIPLVSVVIPSYNHKDYVLTAIHSVLAQTYRSVELIVIDDGSTDGSVELLQSASEDLGFFFMKQQNSGVSQTLNRGIREFSKGEYICVLASDDFFEPEKIEKQMRAILTSSESEFCYTQAVEFEGSKRKAGRVFPKKNYTGYVLKKIFLRQPYAAGSVLFSRKLFDRLGGFDEALAIEDWDFSIRAASVTNFVGVNEPLFHHRLHSDNAMKQLGRRRVFRDKAVILAKNFLLVPARTWVLSVSVHFVHDHFYFLVKYFDIKRWVN